jgi:hypothetical protein
VKEVTTLHARLDPNVSTVVAGDLNETTAGQSVRWLIGQGFTNTLAAPLPTWRGRVAGAPVAARCDHVLHDGSKPSQHTSWTPPQAP